jgi:predicted enzyme related to lactoylglutathione lyase
MQDPFVQHGAFSWVELMTPDPKAAKEFYGKLLGWEMEDMSGQGMAYTVVKAAGKAVGGIMGLPPEAKGVPPQWAAYVTVSDVDASAGRARELGATILKEPTDIPGVGRFCVVRDAQGAVLSLITYRRE